MQVQVITETIQEFNGVRYYLCGKYYQRKGQRLHRVVWEYHHGEIPDGFDVHHIDGDRGHNDEENLACIDRSEHHRHHAAMPDFLEYARKHIEDMRPLAAEWHGSEAGRAWHSAQGKANWEKRKTISYTCTHCGAEFTTKHVYSAQSNRFCSGRCRAAFRRRVMADAN